PRNVGAILRVAAVFGAGAVIMTRHHSPPPSGALTKAASGALEHVPLLAVANLARCMKTLDEAGYMLIGLDEDGDISLQTALQTEQPVAFILGAEGKGLRRLTRTHCQTLAHLPNSAHPQTDKTINKEQTYFTTLNVATAAALALYEWHR
ncbi:MAG: RNA methyltransferase, partial [Alphaproteobacteria bacterium]|nr:RNA methyltransferase [Alphaproteobacteria bacterium]